MSTRERWIVYPILFMTLGIALRDKVVPPELRPLSVKSPRIQCDQLEADQIFCRGATVIDTEDRPVVQLGSNKAGGEMVLVDPDRQIQVFLAHDGQGLVLLGDFEKWDRQTSLTLPCRWQDVRRKMALEQDADPRKWEMPRN